MNIMQMMLQTVSHRSKDIKKREDTVRDKLWNKKICLESKNFNLLEVLRQSLAKQTAVSKTENFAEKSRKFPSVGLARQSTC